MSGRAALVTLAIGAEVSERWHRVCESNWRAYADKHGYDLICIEEPLDNSRRARERSPSWQKLLLLGQPFASEYERIIWVDADVVFGTDAPAITQDVPPGKVGAVNERDAPTPAIERMIYERPTEAYYTDWGLPDGGFEEIVQAGVMVLSPTDHRDLFERVYDAYEDKPGMYYEMRPLSYELIKARVVSWLDPRFNVSWRVYRALNVPPLLEPRRHPRLPELAQRALDEVHCLHFAGEANQMDFTLKGAEGERVQAGRSPSPTRSPVVLFVYARPDTTFRVLNAVRPAKPERLLVVANAPRDGGGEEAERCAATRDLIETVDWDCEVLTNFADEHLPQAERIESGLDWAFELCEEAIVLEDDCVPDETFFRFCEELLARYRDEKRVMSIGGSNFQFDREPGDDSYYFSRYPMIWGWATWRRAWLANDTGMTAWPEFSNSDRLRELLPGPSAIAYWTHILETNFHDRDAWDRAWLLSCWLNDGLHAIPSVNLVSNVGFREDATHTRPEDGVLLGDLPTRPMEFPLRHPAELVASEAADRYTDQLLFGGNIGRMFGRLRRMRRLEESAS
jgi:hypothetical protein